MEDILTSKFIFFSYSTCMEQKNFLCREEQGLDI